MRIFSFYCAVLPNGAVFINFIVKSNTMNKTVKYLGIGCLGIIGIFAILFVIGLFILPEGEIKKAYEEGKQQAKQEEAGVIDTVGAYSSDAENDYIEYVKEPEEEEKKEEVPSKWQYNQEEDKMNDRTTYFASIESDQVLKFDFPYSGGSKSRILIRKGKDGLNVLYTISKGQIITDVSGSNIQVKFDDKKPMTVKATMPSDYSNDAIFLGSGNLLVKEMKKAKKFLIAVDFYDEGTHQIEFDVAGLKWEH